MVERVFLHVGTPKSGSSYLQKILWANRERLMGQGVLLPGSRQSQYQAMADLRGGIWWDETATWTWDKLVRRSRAWPGTVIVSEEMLGAATRAQAESAVRRFGDAEVHVVVVVRDLARSIPSAWQQSVRARTVGSFSSFVARVQDGGNPGFWDNQFAPPVLARWGTELPPERLHVVTVPGAGAPHTLLWERFCSVVGIDPASCDLPAELDNPSLGAAEAELLRRLNGTLGDAFPMRRAYLRGVRRHLTSPVLVTAPDPVRIAAPADLAPWVEQRSRALATELAAVPCHLVGDVADLVPTPSAGRSPDDLDDGELLEVALRTMVGMLQHTTSEVDRLEAEVGELRRRLEPTVPDDAVRVPGSAVRARRVVVRSARRAARQLTALPGGRRRPVGEVRP